MSARVDVRVCLGLQTVSTNSQAIEISARKGIMPKDMTYSKNFTCIREQGRA